MTCSARPRTTGSAAITAAAPHIELPAPMSIAVLRSSPNRRVPTHQDRRNVLLKYEGVDHHPAMPTAATVLERQSQAVEDDSRAQQRLLREADAAGGDRRNARIKGVADDHAEHDGERQHADAIGSQTSRVLPSSMAAQARTPVGDTGQMHGEAVAPARVSPAVEWSRDEAVSRAAFAVSASDFPDRVEIHRRLAVPWESHVFIKQIVYL